MADRVFPGEPGRPDVRVEASFGSGKSALAVLVTTRMISQGVDPTVGRSGALVGVAERETAGATPAELESFVATVRPGLVRVVRAVLARVGADVAEDVVQSALVTVWQRWLLSGPPDNPAAYTGKVAIRLALRYVGETERLKTMPISDETHEPPAVLDIETVPLRVDLDRAIRRLPLRQRAVMRLHLEGKTNQEIARLFKSSPGTVAAQLHTARKALRARLGDDTGR